MNISYNSQYIFRFTDTKQRKCKTIFQAKACYVRPSVNEVSVTGPTIHSLTESVLNSVPCDRPCSFVTLWSESIKTEKIFKN